MNPRTVIITGANSGIGKASAIRFAAEGHTVIMACRDSERSLEAFSEVRQSSGSENVFLEVVDMSSFESIRSFCSFFGKKYGTLDILIHNAAYVSHGAPYQLSQDGIEITFATNVAGPYLMTMLMKDLLARSDDPRILHAGSNIIKHFFDPKKELDFSDLQGELGDHPNHSVYITYRNSKMVLLMLTRKMAAEFKDSGIKVNYLQINGATMSKETLNKMKPRWRAIARIQNLFFRPPEFMANCYYKICTTEKFKEITGQAINHRLEIMQPAPEKPGLYADIKQSLGASFIPYYARRKEVIEKLWEKCMELTELNEPHPEEVSS